MEFQNRKIKWLCPTWKMSWSTSIPTGGSTSMDGSNSEAGFKSTPVGIPASKTSSSISSTSSSEGTIKALFHVSYLLFRTRPHLGPTQKSRVVPEFSLTRSAWIYKGEEKKQEEKEEKEKRKLEREKKKEREKEMQRKAEARAQKSGSGESKEAG